MATRKDVAAAAALADGLIERKNALLRELAALKAPLITALKARAIMRGRGLGVSMPSGRPIQSEAEWAAELAAFLRAHRPASDPAANNHATNGGI